MRIVFDFHGHDPCVSGSGQVYTNNITQPPTWPGFSVDLVIIDTDQPSGGRPFREGDAVYLEGDGDVIRDALTQALRVIDTVEQFARQQFERRAVRTEQCPQCGCWIERVDDHLLPHHAVLTEGSPPCPEGRFMSRI